MKSARFWFKLALLSFASAALAQATRPSDPGVLEARALSAFNRGQYVAALPLLRQVADSEEPAGPAGAGPGEDSRLPAQLEPGGPRQFVPAPAAAADGEQRKPHVRPKDGQVLELSIKELGNFPYDAEKGGNIPDDVKQLSGAKLRTHGFMIPLDQADHITHFALVPSLFACCFGQPPTIEHTIDVTTPKARGVAYYPEEIVIEGTLKVAEQKEDGVIVGLFQLDCTSVKPAPK